jgi:hypothetical protein
MRELPHVSIAAIAVYIKVRRRVWQGRQNSLRIP